MNLLVVVVQPRSRGVRNAVHSPEVNSHRTYTSAREYVSPIWSNKANRFPLLPDKAEVERRRTYYVGQVSAVYNKSNIAIIHSFSSFTGLVQCRNTRSAPFVSRSSIFQCSLGVLYSRLGGSSCSNRCKYSGSGLWTVSAGGGD